jgi:hypothetical protein
MRSHWRNAERAFVARGFIPAGLRSSPLFLSDTLQGAAARPSGDKSPRHNEFLHHEMCIHNRGAGT